MNGLVDFSFCPLNNRNLQYGGREGRKRGIVYEDKPWFLKFPCVLSKHSETVRESFASNVVDEYIGSNIFRTLGYEAQKTLLGVCFDGRGYKAVCACEDFIENEAKEILIPYAELRNDSNPFFMEWRERHYAEPSNLNESSFN